MTPARRREGAQDALGALGPGDRRAFQPRRHDDRELRDGRPDVRVRVRVPRTVLIPPQPHMGHGLRAVSENDRGRRFPDSVRLGASVPACARTDWRTPQLTREVLSERQIYSRVYVR